MLRFTGVTVPFFFLLLVFSFAREAESSTPGAPLSHRSSVVLPWLCYSSLQVASPSIEVRLPEDGSAAQRDSQL